MYTVRGPSAYSCKWFDREMLYSSLENIRRISCVLLQMQLVLLLLRICLESELDEDLAEGTSVEAISLGVYLDLSRYGIRTLVYYYQTNINRDF